MTRPHSPESPERRSADRISIRCDVRVHFDAAPVLGPSANVSRDGLYFFAEGPIRVIAKIVGGKRPIEVRGRLVRAESLNGREIGLAVRFEEPVDPSALD